MKGPKSGDNGAMVSRKPLFLLGVLLAGCPASTAQTGEPCSQGGAGACESPDGGVQRLLMCRASDAGAGNAWEVYSDCRGSGGCRLEKDSTSSCDTSRNTEGDHCAPELEGKDRCDPNSPVNVLRCEGGVLTKVFGCLDSGCAKVDGRVVCQ